MKNEFQFKLAYNWRLKYGNYENKKLRNFVLIYESNDELETKHEKNLKLKNSVVILFSQSTERNVVTQKVSALQTKYRSKNKPKMINQDC